MIIHVPKQQQKPLLALGMLDEPEYSAFAQAINSTAPGLYSPTLADQIVTKLDASQRNTLRPILDSIISLLTALHTSPFQKSDFIDAVIEDLTNAHSEYNKGSVLKERLQTLVNSPTLAISSKGLAVALEQEHIYLDSRILSDIRPVMSDEGSLKIIAAVILHNLKIEYKDATLSKSFFVTLDSDDLKKLRANIDRAIQKTEQLKAAIAQNAIPCLEP